MLLHLALKRLVRHGTLRVRFPDGTLRIYGGGPGPAAGMHVVTARALRRLTFNPSLGLGEAYMDDEIRPEGCGIYDLLDVLVLNLMEGGSHPAERAMELVRLLRRRLDQLNPASRARRNVAHHYDIDRRLYALFLDRDMQYSCGYFATGRESLEEAQEAKKRHIAAKLLLDRPGLEVLDIGCGWGGLGLTLARDFGARVTGITLSTEQLEVARARGREAGLEDRLRFELMDYRAWRHPVDRVVSVGMFEHVGIGHYRTFFRTIRDALRPDGVALVHAIGQPDGPAATNPWLAKYIFPGGYSPALSEVLPAVEAARLRIADIEILRLHYADTIALWRARFAGNRDAIESLTDARCRRMFEFYLAGCELAFRRAGHFVWQLQLARRQDAVPLTRDYIAATERAIAARTREAA